MKVLFLLPAATIYEPQGRAVGWHHTPALRESLKELKALVPRLKELGVTRIIASDLDEQSARAISRKLGVPCELWHSLRRFGIGKHHGDKQKRFEQLWSKMQQTWQADPSIPMQGGDSWISYTKRIAASRARLAQLSQLVIVLAAPLELEHLTGAHGKFEHNRIYEAAIG